jgi:hypothetical protein
MEPFKMEFTCINRLQQQIANDSRHRIIILPSEESSITAPSSTRSVTLSAEASSSPGSGMASRASRPSSEVDSAKNR